AVAEQLEALLQLQLLDVLGEVARGHPLVDVLVAGERRELLDACLHVVARDPLTLGDRRQVDALLTLGDDRLVGLHDAVGHVDAEVALGLQHSHPELTLQDDLVLRRPDRGEVGAGVAGGEHVGDGHQDSCVVREAPSTTPRGSAAMSERRCRPSKSMRSAAAYARARASATSAPVARTASTRPPAVTRRPSASTAVPAWMT